MDDSGIAGYKRRDGCAFGRGDNQVPGATTLTGASGQGGGKEGYTGWTAAAGQILEGGQGLLGAKVLGVKPESGGQGADPARSDLVRVDGKVPAEVVGERVELFSESDPDH